MNAKTLEAVQRHGEQLLAIFPDATEQNPIALCKKLRRIETVANRYALDFCNGDIDPGENYEAVTAEQEKILGRVSALLNPTPEQRAALHFNLDARGYSLKIQDDYMREHNLDLHRDWGGYGILAPDFS